MFKREPYGNQNARISESIEEIQTPDEETFNRQENRCISCIFGTILGISALAILYLTIMTAVAYAIP